MTRTLLAYWEDRRGDVLLALAAGLCALMGCAVWFGWSPWNGGGYHRAASGSNSAIAAQVVRQVEALPTVTGVPVVTPVANLDVSADIARRVNALTPFARGPNPAARPFSWSGNPADRMAAETCLAAAAIMKRAAIRWAKRRSCRSCSTGCAIPLFPRRCAVS
ncbi:Uncharacterised protein [Sphingomonas paucimobilis]|nr:Uncharacterised protein [Sphingomonas paucimobilis]